MMDVLATRKKIHTDTSLKLKSGYFSDFVTSKSPA